METHGFWDVLTHTSLHHFSSGAVLNSKRFALITEDACSVHSRQSWNARPSRNICSINGWTNSTKSMAHIVMKAKPWILRNEIMILRDYGYDFAKPPACWWGATDFNIYFKYIYFKYIYEYIHTYIYIYMCIIDHNVERTSHKGSGSWLIWR